ncbi:MAG: thioesterase [Caldilineaceae bacterium]|nr:thioesterase [Caldilineaceae bacterium]
MSIDRWLRRLRPQLQVRLRLFCFPFAGGSASAYRPWVAPLAALCPEVELCAVQLPGRENRLAEAPFTQMAPLVETLAPLLRPLIDDSPFVFFGHSMGANIAYELAQTLQRIGAPPPLHLFVSARRAPSLPDRNPPLHHLPPDELLQAIGQRYGNMPAALLQNEELKAIYLPLLRADFAMVESYEPSTLTPLACPITALGGDADPIVTQAELLAWRPLTSKAFAFHLFAGDHFYVQKQLTPLIQQIATTLDLVTLSDPTGR